MSIFLCDSCFIIALADNTEAMHNKSCSFLKLHEYGHYYLIPYPAMFEILSQRMVDNTFAMDRLQRVFLKNPYINIAYISDKDYRDVSISECLYDKNNIERDLSLVDTIIRNMIKSKNIRKDALISFNEKDFKDVCNQNGIELYLLN